MPASLVVVVVVVVVCAPTRWASLGATQADDDGREQIIGFRDTFASFSASAGPPGEHKAPGHALELVRRPIKGRPGASAAATGSLAKTMRGAAVLAAAAAAQKLK